MITSIEARQGTASKAESYPDEGDDHVEPVVVNAIDDCCEDHLYNHTHNPIYDWRSSSGNFEFRLA